eukprot:TRINITY_DN938_c4_g1_i1.p1 TRINITY_DN938_c4_g1~~TRINITY_DN938_c4_g1_i1.p1  ORF type:complete len:347 (+),score=65.25 TRINITY_DN938_c4_g1_i1:151-1191(+)
MTDFFWLKGIITVLLFLSAVHGETTVEPTTAMSAMRNPAPNGRGSDCCSDKFTISSADGTVFEVSSSDRTTRTYGPLSVGGGLMVEGAAHFGGNLTIDGTLETDDISLGNVSFRATIQELEQLFAEQEELIRVLTARLDALSGCCATSIHNTLSFSSLSPELSTECAYEDYFKDIGTMDWKSCIRQASRYGAALGPRGYAMQFGGAWRSHRFGPDAAVDPYYDSYESAAIDTLLHCVLVRDSRYNMTDNTASLSNTVVYDGQTWRYQDFGDQNADECDRLPAQAGATIITPWTIGLTSETNWRMKSVGHSTCSWMTSPTTAHTEILGPDCRGEASLQPCMVGYVDN